MTPAYRSLATRIGRVVTRRANQRYLRRSLTQAEATLLLSFVSDGANSANLNSLDGTVANLIAHDILRPVGPAPIRVSIRTGLAQSRSSHFVSPWARKALHRIARELSARADQSRTRALPPGGGA
jgi:hypothetical protein